MQELTNNMVFQFFDKNRNCFIILKSITKKDVAIGMFILVHPKELHSASLGYYHWSSLKIVVSNLQDLSVDC
jgi:hypothetical protein